MTCTCTVIPESSGKLLPRKVNFQEKFLIIEQLYLITRPLFSEVFRITPSVRRLTSLTPRRWLGASLNKQETFPNRETITPSRKLTATPLSFSEDSLPDLGLTSAIFAQRMAELWTGNASERTARSSQPHVHLKVQPFTRVSSTFSEVWTRQL